MSLLQDLNKGITAATKQQEVKKSAVQNSAISSENNSDLKSEINSNGGRGEDYVNIAIPAMNNRISEHEGEEGKDGGRDKIEIDRIHKGNKAEEDIEKNGDEQSRKEKSEGKEVLSDKLKDNKEVVEEINKNSAHGVDGIGFTDLMKSKIQPRMKVFPPF
jgi:hypothetical protein